MKGRAFRIGCSVAVGVMGLLLAVATSRAGDGDAGQTTHERAQRLLERGNELFRAGEMESALRTYGEAHAAFPSPKLFFNMARCEESLGRRALAAQHLARFLREATEVDPLVRAEAQQHLAALTPGLVTIELEAPPNGAVQIDDQPAGLTPFAEPLWLEPGPHRLSVRAAGRAPWLTTFDGVPGTHLSMRVPDEIAAGSVTSPGTKSAPAAPGAASGARPVDASETSRLRRWWWLWTGLGLVAIGAATASYLYFRCPYDKCE